MQEGNFNRQDLIIASLTQQIANLVGQLADRDATITEQHMELEQLKQSQIDEMDKGVKKNVEKQSTKKQK